MVPGSIHGLGALLECAYLSRGCLPWAFVDVESGELVELDHDALYSLCIGCALLWLAMYDCTVVPAINFAL